MDIYTQKCENIIGNNVIMTSSSQRSGKEHNHEERQHAQESAHGLQEKGKRKIVKKQSSIPSSIQVLNAQIQQKNAQMYRRMNNSHSPMIMNEHVSCFPVFVMNAEF